MSIIVIAERFGMNKIYKFGESVWNAERNLYVGKGQYQDRQCRYLLQENHADGQDQHGFVLKQKSAWKVAFHTLYY